MWLVLPMRLVLLAAAAAAAPVRFVVLKRGHSGSTWFSALLQELHLTFFMDEALSAKALAGASRDDASWIHSFRVISIRPGQS